MERFCSNCERAGPHHVGLGAITFRRLKGRARRVTADVELAICDHCGFETLLDPAILERVFRLTDLTSSS